MRIPVLWQTVLLLSASNVFMTFAWYAHLKHLNDRPWWIAALISWGIALFEYSFQVPANRIGFNGDGGPFSLFQLKVIQEVITLLVFTVFTLIVFKTETFSINHLIAFGFLILAVYFIFKK